MDDFLHTIYENALNTGALNHDNSPEYRRAFSEMQQLADKLSGEEAARGELLDAVYEVLFHSDLDALAYGFRLGVRVIASDGL